MAAASSSTAGHHDEMLSVDELGATASTSTGRSEIGETAGSVVDRPLHYSTPRQVDELPSANSTFPGRSPLDGRTTIDNDLSQQLGHMILGKLSPSASERSSSTMITAKALSYPEMVSHFSQHFCIQSEVSGDQETRNDS